MTLNALVQCNVKIGASDEYVTSNAAFFLFEELQGQCELLRNQIDVLTEENIKTTSNFANLLNNVNNKCVDLFLSPNQTCNNKLDDCFDRIDMIENSIKCLDAEIYKLNNNNASCDEKIMKMNGQLHVISAKYIDFNLRINKFLCDFKSTNKINNSTECDKYVDMDTIPFATNDNENVINASSINANQTNHERPQLNSLYYGKPYRNFGDCFDIDKYNSISFKYSLDRSMRKRDFVDRVSIDISDVSKLNISVNELKSLVQLKFNNIFSDICKFNCIITKNVKFQRNIVSGVKFIVIFDKPVNHICLKKFISQSHSELSINFIDYEKLSYLKFFRFSKN